MRTLDIGKLGQEREQLTKRIEQLDTLLAAVELCGYRRTAVSPTFGAFTHIARI